MATFVSLSTDMKKLVFIDASGNTSEFDLNSNGGALLSLTKGGDLKVSAAPTTPSSADVTVSTTNAQWQVSYHGSRNIAFLVGSIDIDTIPRADHHDSDLGAGDFQIWMDGTNLKGKSV